MRINNNNNNNKMKNKRDKILIKIKNLISKTTDNGCSEAESLLAAQKIGELMSKYDVNMSEVEFSEESFEVYEIKLGKRKRDFMSHILMSIGEFTDTKVWITWYSDENTYNYYRKYCFFGTSKDLMIVEYLYSLLKNSINFEFNNYKNSESYKNNLIDGRRKKSNFIIGITNRLSNRLSEMKSVLKDKQKVDDSNNAENNSRMVVDKNIQEDSFLIVYDKFEIVEKKFKEKMNLKLSKSKSNRYITNKDAYREGQEAGDRVNINKAINSEKYRKTKMIG